MVMKRFLFVVGALVSLMLAGLVPVGADHHDPVQVSGSLNSHGQSLSVGIRDHQAGLLAPPPDVPYYWKTFPIHPSICEEGQIGWNAYRVDRATDIDMRFYRIEDGVTRTEYNTLMVGGADPSDVWFVHVCVGPPKPNVDETISALVPSPELGVSPIVRGLTGLETWFWYEQEEPISGYPYIPLTLTVEDEANNVTYTVSAEAWISQYRFDTGDGVILGADRPGGDGEGHAAVTYMYETTGTFDITWDVSWVGEYTWSGYTGVEVLGPLVLSGARPYNVIEIRSVLVD